MDLISQESLDIRNDSDPRCTKGAPRRPIFRGRDADPEHIEGKPVHLELCDAAAGPQCSYQTVLEPPDPEVIPDDNTGAEKNYHSEKSDRPTLHEIPARKIL